MLNVQNGKPSQKTRRFKVGVPQILIAHLNKSCRSGSSDKNPINVGKCYQNINHMATFWPILSNSVSTAMFAHYMLSTNCLMYM